MNIYFSERFPRCSSYLVIQNWRSPDSLFGKVDARKNYTFEQAQKVFKKVWDDGLGEAVKQAPQSNYETVAEQLSDQEQAFLRRDYEHRTVRYRELTFIAQLVKRDEKSYELDQLWFIHSHDKDNVILCVEFESKEERDRFHEIARQLGHSDGRSMLQTYASNLLKEYQDHKE